MDSLDDVSQVSQERKFNLGQHRLYEKSDIEIIFECLDFLAQRIDVIEQELQELISLKRRT